MGEEFNYLNLCSIYETKGYSNVEMSVNPCYAKTLRNWQTLHESKKVSYEIIMFKGMDQIRKDKKNNACLLNRKEISQHLKMIKSIHPFKYRLEEGEFTLKECDNRTYDAWHLFLEIEGTKAQHKFVLTGIRHLYEYPFNVWLIDAHRLKESAPDVFKYTSIMNILQVIKSSFPNDYMTDQSWMFKYRKLLTKSYIKEHLKNIEYITKIYDKTLPPDLFKKIAGVSDKKLFSLDYWLGDSTFQKRREVYLENFSNSIKQGME